MTQTAPAQLRVRYDGLDILKTLYCFSMILPHCHYPGILGTLGGSWAQSAPMIFYMITGFFYADTVRKGRTGAQLKKIVVLTVSAIGLYLVWNIGWNTLYDQMNGTHKLLEFLHKFTDLRNWFASLVCNATITQGHLWYFQAILFVLVLAKLAEKLPKSWRKCLYVLVPLLLVANLVLGEFGPLFGITISNWWYRNFLFLGIPYFCFGLWMRRAADGKRLPSTRTLGIAVVVLLVAMAGETLLMLRYLSRPGATPDMLVSKIFLSPVLFAFALKFYAGRRLNRVEKWAASVGLKYSMLLVIIHPIFIDIYGAAANIVVKALNWSWLATVADYAEPFVVFAATLLASALWLRFKARFTKKTQQK